MECNRCELNTPGMRAVETEHGKLNMFVSFLLEEYGFLTLVILYPLNSGDSMTHVGRIWENQTKSRMVIMRSLLWIVHCLVWLLILVEALAMISQLSMSNLFRTSL